MAVLRIVSLLLCLAAASASAADGLIVAVASNFQSTARELATEFTSATGIPVQVASGSTGHLYAQILNGAPYDVFLAADIERPRLLASGGLAAQDTFFVYATGYVALWSTDPQFEQESCFDDFVNGRYSRLAIANPELAPYGQAAKRVLQAAGLWDGVAEKLVFGESVSQAFQFVATGNASFGLVSTSQVMSTKGLSTSCFIALAKDDVGEARVRQAGVILKRSSHQAWAEKFVNFILEPSMHEFLEQRGYGPAIKAIDDY